MLHSHCVQWQIENQNLLDEYELPCLTLFLAITIVVVLEKFLLCQYAVHNLEYLSISGNFSQLPQIVSKCPNVRYFRIMSEVPIHIGSSLTKLQCVEDLRIDNSIVLSLTNDIYKMSKVKELYMNNTWLRELPEGVFRMKSLTDLRLDFTWVDDMFIDIYGAKYWPFPDLKLPSTIPYNPSIEYIDLDERPISKEDYNRLDKIYKEAME